MPEETARTTKSRPSPRPRTTDQFRCLFCSGVTFRRSRLRPSDFFTMMGLRYPVRCLRCSQRQAVSFSLSGISIPSSVKHHRVRNEAESWKTWTSGSAGAPARPDAPSPASPAFQSVQEAAARRRNAPLPRPKTQREDSEETW